MTRRVRIIATNDFLGSINPLPASYGVQPGAESLRASARLLRDGPSVWIDAGDFAQGGPLSPLSDGRLGFQAASELGIDVASVGNHEFDWGLDALHRYRAMLCFPLLCANAEAGLPATAMVETAAGPIGVVGLTHPDVAALAPGAPPAREETNVVLRSAYRLRRDGARAVVAAIHDGVGWTSTSSAPAADTSELRQRWSQWIHSVDAIIAGHTLGRCLGFLDRTPVLQPWPFGTEIAMLDLELDRSSKASSRGLGSVQPRPGKRWTGAGADAANAAASDVVGRLDAPLAFAPGRDFSLPNRLAMAMRHAAGAGIGFADAGSCAIGQAPIDGVLAYFPAGSLTREQLLRMVPWRDEVVIGDLSSEEVGAIARSAEHTQWRGGGWSTPRSRRQMSYQTLATGQYASRLVDRWVGREVVWRHAGLDVRTAVAKTVSDARA